MRNPSSPRTAELSLRRIPFFDGFHMKFKTVVRYIYHYCYTSSTIVATVPGSTTTNSSTVPFYIDSSMTVERGTGRGTDGTVRVLQYR